MPARYSYFFSLFTFFLLQKLGIEWDESRAKEICSLPIVAKYFLDSLAVVAKSANLAGFEYVKGVMVDVEAFSTDNDLLTPSNKLKRHQLKTHYDLGPLRNATTEAIAVAAAKDPAQMAKKL